MAHQAAGASLVGVISSQLVVADRVVTPYLTVVAAHLAGDGASQVVASYLIEAAAQVGGSPWIAVPLHAVAASYRRVGPSSPAAFAGPSVQGHPADVERAQDGRVGRLGAATERGEATAASGVPESELGPAPGVGRESWAVEGKCWQSAQAGRERASLTPSEALAGVPWA